MSQRYTNATVRKESRERLAQMREAGVEFVGVLGSPNPGETCEACEAIMFTREKDGVKYEIEFATPLPLPGCDKHPCKCVLIAVQ